MKTTLLLVTALYGTIIASYGMDTELFMPIAKGMMTFPESPTEKSFRHIESKMNALPTIQDKEEARHITAICASFLAAAHDRHGYQFESNGIFSSRAKEIVSKKGSFAEYILDDADVDTSKFDVWWMSYLGSQDDKYLYKILKWAGSDSPKQDAVRSRYIQTANWSFKSNCQQIKGVKDFAKRALADPRYKDKQTFLKACISAE